MKDLRKLRPIPSITALLALLVAAGMAFPAGAADLELTPFVGYQFGGTFESDYDDDDDFFDDVDIEESESYGLMLDIGITRNAQIELFYSRQESAFEDSDFFGGLFDDNEIFGDVEIEYFHGGFLYQWAGGQVQPFAVATVGATRFTLPGDSDTRFSAAAGGGVKVFFNDHVGVRFDGRVYSTFIDEDDEVDCRRNRRVCYRYDDDVFLVQLDVKFGLIFAF